MFPLMHFIVTALGLVVLILILFLPMIIELRNPKDQGPRLIAGYLDNLPFSYLPIVPDIEVDAPLRLRIGGFLSLLPNVESFFFE